MLATIPLLKKSIAVASTIFLTLGFKDYSRPLGKGDRRQDKYWKPFLFLLNIAVAIGFYGLTGWYLLSPDSSALQPWSVGEAVASVISIGAPLLRLWSMHTLGKTYFTFVVTIRQNHELITSGPYRLLMHPSYTGLIAGLLSLLPFLGGPGGWLRSWMFWCWIVPTSLTGMGKFKYYSSLLVSLELLL